VPVQRIDGDLARVVLIRLPLPGGQLVDGDGRVTVVACLLVDALVGGHMRLLLRLPLLLGVSDPLAIKPAPVGRVETRLVKLVLRLLRLRDASELFRDLGHDTLRF